MYSMREQVSACNSYHKRGFRVKDEEEQGTRNNPERSRRSVAILIPSFLVPTFLFPRVPGEEPDRKNRANDAPSRNDREVPPLESVSRLERVQRSLRSLRQVF